MRQAGEPRRDDRMIALEEARLEDARGDLRRPDQRAGGDRLHRRGAGRLQDAREVRGHRARHHPGGGEGERQQHHGAIDRDVRLDGGLRRRLRDLYRGQHQAD